MAFARLILVTGKGGTGKSTVAAALALALARRHPTLLVDLDQRMWATRMLGIESGNDRIKNEQHLNGADAVANPTATAKASQIANLETLSLGPKAELEAFIERIVPIKAIARRMLKSRTFGYVSAALPGLEAATTPAAYQVRLRRLLQLVASCKLPDRSKRQSTSREVWGHGCKFTKRKVKPTAR